jgi:hypothetical protein
VRTSFQGSAMSRIDQIKAQIERLPEGDIAEIFRWLSAKDWERWDRQVEADSEAGRLDFLIREAQQEKSQGKLKDL